MISETTALDPTTGFICGNPNTGKTGKMLSTSTAAGRSVKNFIEFGNEFTNLLFDSVSSV